MRMTQHTAASVTADLRDNFWTVRAAFAIGAIPAGIGLTLLR